MLRLKNIGARVGSDFKARLKQSQAPKSESKLISNTKPQIQVFEIPNSPNIIHIHIVKGKMDYIRLKV